MERREFLRRMTLALAAGWTWGRLCWPSRAMAGDAPCRLAFLADSHLKNGDDRLPGARALARAVAEVRAMQPRPDLVLVAGDLAHDGNPQALALGREILSDLPAPVLMVKGEGDGSPESAPWRRLFGAPWFIRYYNGVNILGLYTYLSLNSHGPAFELGSAQIAWLARELARLDPAAPLVVLSHAPLTPVFRPWGQWTRDGEWVTALSSRFPQAVYLHGHVHQAVPSSQFPVASDQWSGVSGRVSGFRDQELGANIFNHFTENRKPKTENRFSLPATAWPLPSPLLGTPAYLSPGHGPRGCGWAQISLRAGSWQFQPQVWAA